MNELYIVKKVNTELKNRKVNNVPELSIRSGELLGNIYLLFDK